MAKKTIRSIPVKKKYTGAVRVGIYCRVSSSKKDQLKSLAAQISGLTNYTAYIPTMVLFDTYVDVAPGSTLSGRPEFQRLLMDCESGRIQFVLTKSASRFSRDILVAMAAIQKLRHVGVTARFIAEGIDSDNPDIQVHLAAHFAAAEMENENRSTNVKWGIRASASEGESKYFNKICYGYKHDKNDNLAIKEDEAKNVARIFRLYLEGYSVLDIIKDLERCGIKSPTGKDKWNKRYIEKMLVNRKYAGDSVVMVEGDQYVYGDHHPAIIPHDAFDAVQMQKSIRSNLIENDDGTVSRKDTKYSSKKVRHLTFNIEDFLADLDERYPDPQ